MVDDNSAFGIGARPRADQGFRRCAVKIVGHLEFRWFYAAIINITYQILLIVSAIAFSLCVNVNCDAEPRLDNMEIGNFSVKSHSYDRNLAASPKSITLSSTVRKYIDIIRRQTIENKIEYAICMNFPAEDNVGEAIKSGNLVYSVGGDYEVIARCYNNDLDAHTHPPSGTFIPSPKDMQHFLSGNSMVFLVGNPADSYSSLFLTTLDRPGSELRRRYNVEKALEDSKQSGPSVGHFVCDLESYNREDRDQDKILIERSNEFPKSISTCIKLLDIQEYITSNYEYTMFYSLEIMELVKEKYLIDAQKLTLTLFCPQFHIACYVSPPGDDPYFKVAPDFLEVGNLESDQSYMIELMRTAIEQWLSVGQIDFKQISSNTNVVNSRIGAINIMSTQHAELFFSIQWLGGFVGKGDSNLPLISERGLRRQRSYGLYDTLEVIWAPSKQTTYGGCLRVGTNVKFVDHVREGAPASAGVSTMTSGKFELFCWPRVPGAVRYINVVQILSDGVLASTIKGASNIEMESSKIYNPENLHVKPEDVKRDLFWNIP